MTSALLRMIWLALICSATFFSSSALGQPAAKEPQRRIGSIYIVGNEFTRQDVILKAVGLSPGWVLRDRDLRIAEENLARLGIFKFDPATGVRPTVTVLDPDGPNEFKEILVQVQETPTRCVRFMPGLTSKGELVVSLVCEERNFDPSRWPTSLDDMLSGGVLRGAGQLFRLELLQIPVFPPRAPCFLQFGSFLFPVGGSSNQAKGVRSGS